MYCCMPNFLHFLGRGRGADETDISSFGTAITRFRRPNRTKRKISFEGGNFQPNITNFWDWPIFRWVFIKNVIFVKKNKGPRAPGFCRGFTFIFRNSSAGSADAPQFYRTPSSSINRNRRCSNLPTPSQNQSAHKIFCLKLKFPSFQ